MKTVVITFGRFNPITIGHEKLVNRVLGIAKAAGGTPQIYASHSQDAKKNPLSYEDKIKLMRTAFGNIVVPSPARNIIEVLKTLDRQFQHVVVVVGSDRVNEFQKLVANYNNKEYKFDKVEVKSAGERDPDADDAAGASGTKMRQYVIDNDLVSFKKGLPSPLRKIGNQIFKKVKTAMHLKEEIEIEDFTEEELQTFVDQLDFDALDEQDDMLADLDADDDDDIEETLNIMQRRKRAIVMRRLRPRLKRMKKIRAKRMAEPAKLAVRARKAALQMLRKRLAGQKGAHYATLSTAEKMSIDKRLDGKKAIIGRISKRLLPMVRKKEIERLKKARSNNSSSVVGQIKSRVVESRYRAMTKDVEQIDEVKKPAGFSTKVASYAHSYHGPHDLYQNDKDKMRHILVDKKSGEVYDGYHGTLENINHHLTKYQDFKKVKTVKEEVEQVDEIKVPSNYAAMMAKKRKKAKSEKIDLHHLVYSHPDTSKDGSDHGIRSHYIVGTSKDHLIRHAKERGGLFHKIESISKTRVKKGGVWDKPGHKISSRGSSFKRIGPNKNDEGGIPMKEGVEQVDEVTNLSPAHRAAMSRFRDRRTLGGANYNRFPDQRQADADYDQRDADDAAAAGAATMKRHAEKEKLKLKGTTKEEVDEVIKPGTKVMITQGKHKGKTAHVGEVDHGIHKTARKEYVLDTDFPGERNVRVGAHQIRVHKKPIDEAIVHVEEGRRMTSSSIYHTDDKKDAHSTAKHQLAKWATVKEDVDQIEEARRGRPRKEPLPPGQEDEGTENIIMQLRKVVSLNGKKPVVFDDGKKANIAVPVAKKALNMFALQRTSIDKGAFMKRLARNSDSFKLAVSGAPDDKPTHKYGVKLKESVTQPDETPVGIVPIYIKRNYRTTARNNAIVESMYNVIQQIDEVGVENTLKSISTKSLLKMYNDFKKVKMPVSKSLAADIAAELNKRKVAYD